MELNLTLIFVVLILCLLLLIFLCIRHVFNSFQNLPQAAGDAIAEVSVTMSQSFNHLSDKLSETTDLVVQTCVNQFVSKVNAATEENLTLSGLLRNANAHKIGLTLCVNSMRGESTVLGVLSEGCKVASMLGLEVAAVNAAINRLTRRDIEEQVEQHGMREYVSLAGTAVSLLDLEIGDVNLDKLMNKTARNIKNLNIMGDHFEKCLISAGLMKPSNYDVLTDLNAEIDALKGEHTWLIQMLALKGSDFCMKDNFKRVEDYKKRVDSISMRLRKLDLPDLRNNQIAIEINNFIRKADDYLAQIMAIRESIGLRMVPVGICLQGETQLGKTTLIPELISRVTEKLIPHANIVGDPTRWVKWDANQREEFDSGYKGQQIVYMDDAFQDKSHKDHLMWFSYVSSAKVGTIQGVAEQKGLPFNGLLCLTSCNQLPTVSTTVNDIRALHERFPITIKVEGKRRKAGDDYDKDFKHLNFRVGKMSELVNQSPALLKRIPQKTLDQVADTIVEQFLANAKIFQQRMEVQQRSMVAQALLMRPEENLQEQALSDQAIVYEDETFMRLEATRQEVVVRKIGRLNEEIYNDFVRAHTQVHLNGIGDLSGWQNLLHMRVGGRLIPLDMDRHEGDLFSFLMALGAYSVKDEDRERFMEMWLRQPCLRLEDNYGDILLWSPLVQGGRILFMPNQNLLVELRACQYWVVREGIRVSEQWANAGFRDGYWVNIAAMWGMTFVNQSWPVLVALQLYNWSSALYLRGVYAPLQAPVSWRALRHNVLWGWTTPIWIAEQQFGFFRMMVAKLKSGVISLVGRLLEVIGIDVTAFWRHIGSFVLDTTAEMAVIALSGILVYLIYKVVRCAMGPSKIQEHSGKNWHRTVADKGKKQKQQKIVVRRLNQQSGENQKEEVTVCQFVENSFVNFKVIDEIIHMSESSEGSLRIEFDIDEKNIYVTQKEADDFLVQETKFIRAMRESVVINNRNGYIALIEYEFKGTAEALSCYHDKIVKAFKDLNVREWQSVFLIRLVEDDTYHLKVCMECLSTTIQGISSGYTLKSLSCLKEIADRLSGRKVGEIKTVSSILEQESIEQHGDNAALDLAKVLVKRHAVKIQKVPLHLMDDFGIRGWTIHGLGHLGLIFGTAHEMAVGDLVRFRRLNDEGRFYQTAIVERCNYERDLMCARIISKKETIDYYNRCKVTFSLIHLSSVRDQFRDLSPHLATESQLQVLTDNNSCLVFLPSAGSLSVGQIKHVPKKNYLLGTLKVEREYLEISKLQVNCTLARPGDCGGLVMSFKDRYLTKIVGMHGGSVGNRWLAVIFIREDLESLIQHAGRDLFEQLILKGEPTDLPSGSECEFIGKYMQSTKPASDVSLKHWRKSPFAAEFVEQMAPGPLDAYDSRIEVELPKNLDGRKSLLMNPAEVLTMKLPEMDDLILDQCVNDLAAEMVCKIGELKTVKEDVVVAIAIGLNGDRENEFVTNMTLDKACGLPWNGVPGKSKKSDYLKNTNGYVEFIDNEGSLARRVRRKLLAAKQGERLISFVNSKLKDQAIKLSAIAAGKTRVFHCVPVDKVICDATLFGNFKEAYTKAFLDLNHAVGVDPHSTKWDEVLDHISKHPNIFDIDFSNYDKRLHAELMHGVFRIIRHVINEKAPDGWDVARGILEQESISSYVVEYDTIYKTYRGNKSGEYLTTVVNCIANEILSYYSWMKVTGNRSLADYRENTAIVTFGDDKVESVSDEYAEQYNYLTVKEVMTSIGHVITPGNKDGVESEFTQFDQIRFLKREFKQQFYVITAPLEKRSIESPFVWTQNENSALDIWYNLVSQQLIEAMLHGEEYYDEFRCKLMKCDDEDLVKHVGSLLGTSYKAMADKYLRARYHQKNEL